MSSQRGEQSDDNGPNLKKSDSDDKKIEEGEKNESPAPAQQTPNGGSKQKSPEEEKQKSPERDSDNQKMILKTSKKLSKEKDRREKTRDNATVSENEKEEIKEDKKEEKKEKPKTAKRKPSKEKMEPKVGESQKREKKGVTASRSKHHDVVAGTSQIKQPQANRSKHQLVMPAIVLHQPKDEPELSTLLLDGALLANAKLMEDYRHALQQIHNHLLMLMRRGNGTTDLEYIRSEKMHSAPELLNKFATKTESFWRTDKKLQPTMNESLAANTAHLGQVERNMQDQGVKHLKKIKKFIYVHYATYVDLKKQLAKVVSKNPDNVNGRTSISKKIDKLIKEKYLQGKKNHVIEIQSAFLELTLFHNTNFEAWRLIADRKLPTGTFEVQKGDHKQFAKLPE
uniref:Uncharacterized protein n=1 Tax=Caenorhabditis japonica TaxID=281687 RepID=A0A8R1DGX7_CAEJA